MKTEKQEQAWERLQERIADGGRQQQRQDLAAAFAKKPETAIELLREPDDLFYNFLIDTRKAGLVREHRNALATWIAATSRLRDQPINQIIKGASASGKNFLAKSVFKFLPPEDVVEASSLSKHALNYLGPDALRHRVLYIDELNAAGAVHPARQLISEGRLIHKVTIMQGGKRVTVDVVINGPVAAVTTSTLRALKIDDETRNFSTWIDESYHQTKAIALAQAKNHQPLSPERFAVWHAVQDHLKTLSEVPIRLPKWFALVVERHLPYGDRRIRRYWPAFVEACKVVCLMRQAHLGIDGIERRGGLTVDFKDFAVTNQIFDQIIQQSLTLSASDRDIGIADVVDHLVRREGLADGVAASDMVGFRGIRSIDQAYRWLRAAEQSGAIYRVNVPERNNEKRYKRSEEARFLGEPEIIYKQLGLKGGGTYIHPITRKSHQYGND